MGHSMSLRVGFSSVYGFFSSLGIQLSPWNFHCLYSSLSSFKQWLVGWFWSFKGPFSLVIMAHGVARNVGTRKRKEGFMEEKPSTSKDHLLSSQAIEEAWEVEKSFKGKVPVEAREYVEELEKEVRSM
jgi:hypothetical protein